MCALRMWLFSCSVVFDFSAMPWTVSQQAFLSMGFPRQEYHRGLPFPSCEEVAISFLCHFLPSCEEDLHSPGMEPAPPVLQADSL